MKDSYQKFADDMFGEVNNIYTSIFSRVQPQDLDEVRVAFAVKVSHLEYADNFRIYPLAEKEAFYKQADRGCCGSWNGQTKCLSGNIYWVGCNYGH